MSDTYISLVNGGLTGTLARRLGLPRPSVLRRFEPSVPLVTGPLLVLGGTTGTGEDADVVAQLLLSTAFGADLDVRRASAGADGVRWGAIVVVLTEASVPTGLADPVLGLASTLRSLAPGGRVITVSRAATDRDAPALAATRQGIDGVLRSVAKELRGGATANGILLADGVGLGAPSVLGGLRFLLSARSAFIDGQFLTIGSAAGSLSTDWDLPLSGRVAVVTGAARGIGAAIARTLARDGARVVVVDVPAAGESLAAVANEIKGTALQLDITADAAGRRIIDHAVARHGGVDIVVHNAGITRDKLLANLSEDMWTSVIAVNIAAQLRINDALLASPAFTRAPRIVSLASTSGIAGNRGQTNYAASKGGVIGMAKATGPLLASVGGTVNAVAPGFIETDMTARIPLLTRQVARRLNSLQQGGQPVDVAEAIAFLASPAAGGINGTVLRVCGQNLVGA
jgi:3-oxoacyl-[acyl-carrier protein] reductase